MKYFKQNTIFHSKPRRLYVAKKYVQLFFQVVHLHTNTACSKLVNLFQDTLDLENDLIYLRRVFFMEAGDLLSEFYTQLFTKLAENPEECDTLSLSVILHDCLCRQSYTSPVL